MQKNSEYLGLINHWLHKLEEDGVKERMWKNWTTKASEEFWFEEPIPLSYNNMVFIFLLIMGGIVISAWVVLCERMVDNTAKLQEGHKAWSKV